MIQALSGQLLVGLINGSFYALLSLGLAIIFGLLDVVNFAHGAQYMLGAFLAWMAMQYLGINYWSALILVPLAVGVLAIGLSDSWCAVFTASIHFTVCCSRSDWRLCSKGYSRMPSGSPASRILSPTCC